MSTHLPRKFPKFLILPALLPLLFLAGAKAFDNSSSVAASNFPKADYQPSNLSIPDSHVWVDTIWCYNDATQEQFATSAYLDGGDGFHQGYNFGYSGTSVTYSFTRPVTRAGFELMGEAGAQITATPNNGPSITKTLEPWEIFGNPQTPKADFDFFGGGITSITIVSQDPNLTFWFSHIGFEPCEAPPPPPPPTPTPTPASSPTPTPTPTPIPTDDVRVAPLPYPSPVQTDSSFYGTPPNEAFTHTVSWMGGAITRNVDISRVVGDVNPGDGTLQYASDLINNGVVSRYAILKIPAYDVDAAAGEQDHVLFNGVEIGPNGSPAYLQGKDKAWRITQFLVPIELVHFATRNPGHPPSPGHNEITIFVDEVNAPKGIERWRVAVGAPKIEFEALYPVVMIHGNNSCGNFYAGDFRANCQPTSDNALQPEPPSNWFIKPFQDMKIPFDNSIAMDTDTVAQHADWLLNGGPHNKSIKSIAAEWGAKHVHIIAHSKGRIDVREFLTRLPSGYEPADFGVISFTTMSSPHLGSVGADYESSIRDLNKLGQLNPDNIALSDNPLNAGLAATLKTDIGIPDLRVDKMTAFNKRNIPALPYKFTVDGQTKPLRYFAIGADANLDDSTANGSVIEKFHPEKYLPTITNGNFGSTAETEGVPYIPYVEVLTTLGKGALYTRIYRMFGTVHEAKIVPRNKPGLLFPRPIPVISEIPEPCFFTVSDFAVTQASAVAEAHICDWPPNVPNPSLKFTGTSLIHANHATMSSPSTALIIINWIRNNSQPMPVYQ